MWNASSRARLKPSRKRRQIVRRGEKFVDDARRRHRVGGAQQDLAAAVGMQQRRADAEAVQEGGANQRKPQMRAGGGAAEHELDIGHRKFGPRLDERMQTARHYRSGPGAEQISADHAHGHAVEAHLAMERAGLRPRVGHVRAEMILQIFSDRQVGRDVDAEAAQMLRRSDAGEHQELRRVEGAGREDDFARCAGAHVSIRLVMYSTPRRARAVERDAGRVRVGGDGEIFSSARRLEIGIGGGRTPAVREWCTGRGRILPAVCRCSPG